MGLDFTLSSGAAGLRDSRAGRPHRMPVKKLPRLSNWAATLPCFPEPLDYLQRNAD